MGRVFSIPKAFGIDVENQCLINHKCVCGALNRHFCQTRVTSCPSVCRGCFGHSLSSRCALAWWLFWIFLALVFALKKNTNVPPNALALIAMSVDCIIN